VPPFSPTQSRKNPSPNPSSRAMAMSTRFATCSACSLPQGVLVQEPPEHRPELDGLLDVSTVGMAHQLAVRRRRPHRLQEDRPWPRQGLPAPHTPRRAQTTAGNNPTGGGSYSYEAIRRHCKAEAPATLLLSLVGRSSSSTSLIYLVR